MTGDNGLLQKATTAKQANEEASVLEMIKTEVVGSYNLEGKIDLNELKTNLKHLNISDEDIKPTIKNNEETFPVVVKINGYSIDILEDGTVDKTPEFEILESSYGYTVNGYIGYTATDVTEWKLLYVDEENRDAFIISSNTLPRPQPTANGIPLVSKKGIEYSGSNNVTSFEYGRKYNGLWLAQCINENTNPNAKATAYMCDPENWNQYVTGKAKYAAGGATLEIFVASYYNKQISEFYDSEYNEKGKEIREANITGYPQVLGKNTLQVGSLYNTGNHAWISSPSNYAKQIVRVADWTGSISNSGYDDTIIGLRPIVCLPASAIEVVGEGENITLNYK